MRTSVPAPPSVVWADIADIASHVEWMNDAVSITFDTPQRTGVGTSFVCLTAVGPIRLQDRMTVTSWEDGSSIGIRHAGLVTGTGVLRVRRRLGRGSVVTWDEQLHLPWWMGGPLGGIVARPVLKHIWKGSMRNRAARFPAA